MGKVMISLTDEAEQLVRDEIDKVYYGRTGAVSIFFESLVRKYFDGGRRGSSVPFEKKIK